MNGHDDEFLDEVAVFALGALPATQARTMAAHVRECEACRALYSALRPAADRVGYVAEEAAGTDALAAARRKKRIMTSVRETLEPSGTHLPRRQHGMPVLPWGVAAAALLIALGLGIQNADLRQAHEHAVAVARHAAARQIALTTQVRRERTRAARIALEASAQRRLLSKDMLPLLEPSATRYAVAHGVVVISNGKLFLALHGLRQPPPHKVYETWMLPKGAKHMQPGGTFRPNADGIAVIEFHARAAGVAAVALTMEPAGGSPAPTTKPEFVRKLS